ncbi:hypothetical protein Acr_00g0073980 [Actinidia rufa]|uniref:Uncharacterized protein n=1 Tax=Actinidia rufa TaxID=165716 RepID=A0A7J0DSQ8_9ERIC|nr:hypothetical protein Acr_00g0073980 [Actinidia rufa]
MVSNGEDNGEEKITGDTAHVATDEGTIKKGMSKVLPRLFNLTLLRLPGEKVQTPILGLEPSNSSSSLKAWPNLQMPPEAQIGCMSRKIDMKKLALMAKETTSAAKGVLPGSTARASICVQKADQIIPSQARHPRPLNSTELVEEEEGEEKGKEEKGKKGELDENPLPQ